MFGAKESVVWTTSTADDQQFSSQGEDEGRGRRCGGVLNPGVRMQDDQQTQGQKHKAGGCGILDPVVMMQESLQASRAMAYQGNCSPVETEGISSPEGTRARAGPLRYAVRRDVLLAMESNNISLRPAMGNSLENNNTSLHPSIGRWKLNNISRMPLHPSVGSFKRDGVNLFDFECAGSARLEKRARERRPVAQQRQQCSRGPALPQAGWRTGAKTSMQ